MIWLRLVGRIAFPIFLFLVGFNLSYKRRWDLLLRAIMVQIPVLILAWYFHFWTYALNILFGIIIGRAVLKWVEGRRSKIEGQKKWLSTLWTLWPLPLRCMLLTIVLLCVHPWLKGFIDYGSFVILFPLMGWLFKVVKGQRSKVEGQKKWLWTLWTLWPLPLRCMLLTYGVLIFACLFGFTQTIFGFSSLQLTILGGFFIILLCIFFVLWQGNHFLPLGKKIDAGVLFISKNALLIYIFHLLVLWVIKIFLMWRQSV